MIQAAHFALAMLDRAFPEQAPFTPQNTKVIATGLSNGGGAVLQAAGLDQGHLFAGVVALEPNVHVADRGRAMFDYATEASIWLPCALTTPRFAHTPLARDAAGQPPPAWPLRCASLHAQGAIAGATPGDRAEAACQHLRAGGWTDEAMTTAASTTAFDLWRVITAGYASSYLRRGAGNMPCGFHYGALAPTGVVNQATRAAWWANGSGIPPGEGIGLLGGIDVSTDPTLAGSLCLRALWAGEDADAHALRIAVAATAAQLPRAGLPMWIVHGASDGLIPTAFSSEPYVAWLREHDRQPLYWRVPYAQHFDAFLALPDFGDRHVPLLPYGYAALDRLWRHLFEGQSWPAAVAAPSPSPRGSKPLTAHMLNLPQ